MGSETNFAKGGPIALILEILKTLRTKIWIAQKVETDKIWVLQTNE